MSLGLLVVDPEWWFIAVLSSCIMTLISTLCSSLSSLIAYITFEELHHLVQYYKLIYCKPNFLLRLLLSLLFVVELKDSSTSVCTRIMSNNKLRCVKQEKQSNGAGNISKPSSEKEMGTHSCIMKTAFWRIYETKSPKVLFAELSPK